MIFQRLCNKGLIQCIETFYVRVKSTARLEFSLSIGLGNVGALHGTQERHLRGEGGDGFILRLLASLVLRLEVLQEFIQVVPSLLDVAFESFNFRGERFRGQSLLFRNHLLLIGVAEINVVGAARRAQRLRGERLERFEVTAALVRVTSRRSGASEILQRRVTLHTNLLARRLFLGAVDFADDHVVVVRERLAELLPGRRDRLAVPAPIKKAEKHKTYIPRQYSARAA